MAQPTYHVPDSSWVYSLHWRQYWGGSLFMMLCPMQCCTQCCGYAVVALWTKLYATTSGIRQIVCGIKLGKRLATLLNVARDSQNISSIRSHMLHETVQTYDVEMTCQHSIYSANVTNNHAEPEVQALHTAIWLKINIITLCALLIFMTAQPIQDKNMKYT